jgi:hypothetical protein
VLCSDQRISEKGHRKVIENATKDLEPDTKYMVIQLLDSEDIHAEERLKDILGQERSDELLNVLKEKKDDT